MADEVQHRKLQFYTWDTTKEEKDFLLIDNLK